MKQPIEQWLLEEVIRAQEEAVESHKIDANCYGAGYDQGYLDAMRAVLAYVKEE